MSSNSINYERHAANGRALVEVVGSFVTAGASAPSVIKGKGFTVSAPSTGVYTITLDRKYPGLESAVATLGGGAVAADVRIGTYNPATGVITIVTEGATRGTAANLTGPVVNFRLYLNKYLAQV
jgi:hypothetical protein